MRKLGKDKFSTAFVYSVRSHLYLGMQSRVEEANRAIFEDAGGFGSELIFHAKISFVSVV
jgi:hypothetical protein